MQIDFHHGVTYVVSRLAGFDAISAEVMAYCAQYVDDATNEGIIHFDNGFVFKRLSSAHKMLNYRNFRQLAQHKVWIPFHFLPGNGGFPLGQGLDQEPIYKLICLPNSYVAQDLLKECIYQRYAPYSLHWLGIALHVYADTWAHQGFAGVNHPVNEAKLILDGVGRPDNQATSRVRQYFHKNKNLMTRIANTVMSETMPIGHGAVLSHPDQPYLKWGYINGLNQVIQRNNAKDFLEAADFMYQWLQRYRLGNVDAVVPRLPSEDKAVIANLLENLRDKRGKVRHQQWLEAIKAGKFSFGASEVKYIPKGKGSWKYDALGTEKERDSGSEIFPYSSQFLASHWKLFHDALEKHRFFVAHELLPRYGISVDC